MTGPMWLWCGTYLAKVMAKSYRTVSHVDGWTGLPQYEIRDNKVYRAVSHVSG